MARFYYSRRKFREAYKPAGMNVINHHQTYLIASNPVSLRRLFCSQFRRQYKREWCGHQKDCRTKSTKLATGPSANRNLVVFPLADWVILRWLLERGGTKES